MVKVFYCKKCNWNKSVLDGACKNECPVCLNKLSYFDIPLEKCVGYPIKREIDKDILRNMLEAQGAPIDEVQLEATMKQMDIKYFEKMSKEDD